MLVPLGAREALPLPPRLRSFSRGSLVASLGRLVTLGGFSAGGFGLEVRRRLGLGDRRLFRRGLLGGRLLSRGLLGFLLGLFGLGWGFRLLLRLGGGSDGTFGRRDRLALLLVLVLCLLVLFFVSHSSLDSRSFLVPCGRSECGRSHASRASAGPCSPARRSHPGSAG